jgi:hypothetical protein
MYFEMICKMANFILNIHEFENECSLEEVNVFFHKIKNKKNKMI